MKAFFSLILTLASISAFAGPRWDYSHLRGDSRSAAAEQPRWKFKIISHPGEATLYMAYNNQSVQNHKDETKLAVFCYSSGPNPRLLVTVADAERADKARIWDINVDIGGERLSYGSYENFAGYSDYYLNQKGFYLDLGKEDYLLQKLLSGQDAYVSVTASHVEPFFYIDRLVDARIPLEGASAALNQLNQYCRLY